jgi:hypothetical protein
MTSLGVDSITSLVIGLPSPASSDEDLVLGQAKSQPTSGLVSHERKLGDSELSYYLPGRAAGVNDMCAAPLIDGLSNWLTILTPGISTWDSSLLSVSWFGVECALFGLYCACVIPFLRQGLKWGTIMMSDSCMSLTFWG